LTTGVIDLPLMIMSASSSTSSPSPSDVSTSRHQYGGIGDVVASVVEACYIRNTPLALCMGVG